jgi:hypothetical protein
MISLHAVNLRAEGLIALTNSLKDFKCLEKLILSSNKLALNSFGDKYVAGVETFCSSLWEAPKLAELE